MGHDLQEMYKKHNSIDHESVTARYHCRPHRMEGGGQRQGGGVDATTPQLCASERMGTRPWPREQERVLCRRQGCSA